jgi:hypothetical protein
MAQLLVVPEGERAVKHDEDKARFDLIPLQALWRLAEVYTLGAKKYAPRNWEKGMAWGRVFSAVMRHLWKWWGGETNDPEDGISHLMHAAWGCFTLFEYEHTHVEFDDRPARTEKR